MTDNLGANELPNRNDCSESSADYLGRAADACADGDLVLGMHLYLAAYEQAVADPDIPDGMALAGLREAWSLACDLKERSMAEYIFEKLEPYLTGEEIAACAAKLQSLALDRLEEYGFSREELEGMAEMIAQDFGGGEASVVKVESISIPNAGMFGVPGYQVEAEVEVLDADDADDAGDAADAADAVEAAETAAAPDEAPGDAGDAENGAAGEPSHVGLGVAHVNDFNPYDEYRDYSIGKSYHAATNEGSGAAVFTRDAERAEVHEQYLETKDREAEATGSEAPRAAGEAEADRQAAADQAEGAQDEVASAAGSAADSPEVAADAPKHIQKRGEARPAKAKGASMPSMPDVRDTRPAGRLDYQSLVGYDEAVSVMRDYGIGLQNDRGFIDFMSMLNENHGLDRPPALDTLLFRAPVLEDASRFVEATVGEIGLPTLRMSMEESVQGMPVLCVMVQGNHRPRMNHAQNRFEAPAILIIEDLENWSVPAPPEGVEGISSFVMANISRGARDAVNLIRSAVEDPDVFVLATATTEGDVEPFFYDMLEPLTVIDIGLPTDAERADIWTEIAQDHPSMRSVSRSDLMRLSAGMPRYDIYMAAREAIEEAYKQGLVQRSYIPVTPQNIFEKLAACQPLDSDEYLALEDEVIRNFKRDLDRLDDLLEGFEG